MKNCRSFPCRSITVRIFAAAACSLLSVRRFVKICRLMKPIAGFYIECDRRNDRLDPSTAGKEPIKPKYAELEQIKKELVA